MNKKLIDRMLGDAYRMLAELGISKNDSVDIFTRAAVMQYGVQMIMSTPLSATASLMSKGGSSVQVTKLLYALMMRYHENVVIEDVQSLSKDQLFQYIKENDTKETKEMLLCCVRALRLAIGMCLYEVEKEEEMAEEAEL